MEDDLARFLEIELFLMRDQNMLNFRRINIQPPHFLPQPVIVISGVDHNRHAVLRIKENVCDPLSNTGNMFIDPAGIDWLKNLFSAIAEAHYLFLKIRRLL